MKRFITILMLISQLNSNAVDFGGGGGDLSGILDAIKSQLEALQQIAKSIGDASKMTVVDAMQEVASDLELPTQLVQLWETADGLRAVTETAAGLYSEIQTTIKLWDGSVLERSLDNYKPLDALQQAVKNSIRVSSKNDVAKRALQLELDLVQKAALAAPITEVLRLQVVASGLEARMLKLSIEELAAQQKALLQNVANQAAAEARSQAAGEEAKANLAAVPVMLNRFFPVFEGGPTK